MLDLFSVLVVFFIVIIITVITLFAVKWQYGKEYPGINDWLYGFLVMGVAFFIIVMLQWIPYIPGMLVSNTLLMIGLIIIHIGLLRFFKEPLHLPRQGLILGTAVLLYLIFTFGINSLVLRNIVLTTVFIIVFSQTFVVSLRHNELTTSAVRWSSITFLLAIIVSVARLVSLIVAPDNVHHYHDYASSFEIATLIVYLSLVLMLLLSLLLLLSDRMLESILKAERKFKESFRLSPGGLLLFKQPTGEVVEVNDAFLTMTETTRAYLFAKPVWAFGFWDKETRALLEKLKSETIGQAQWTHETTLGEKHIMTRASSLQIDGSPHVLVSFEDLTAVYELQKKFERLARHDPLTDLPNRRNFEEHFEAITQSHLPIALALGDIDNFKEINDQHGHDFGDEVLVEIAKRIRQALDTNYHVARFGGDEFIFLFDSVKSQKKAKALVQGIVDAMDAPMDIDGITIDVSVSFGVVHTERKEAFKVLLKEADKAMYEAKHDGPFVMVNSE